MWIITKLTNFLEHSMPLYFTSSKSPFSFLTMIHFPGKAPLAGNSVHADKKFLDKYMPKLMGHLHYRIVDVSTVKELCR